MNGGEEKRLVREFIRANQYLRSGIRELIGKFTEIMKLIIAQIIRILIAPMLPPIVMGGTVALALLGIFSSSLFPVMILMIFIIALVSFFLAISMLIIKESGLYEKYKDFFIRIGIVNPGPRSLEKISATYAALLLLATICGIGLAGFHYFLPIQNFVSAQEKMAEGIEEILKGIQELLKRRI